MDNCTFKLGIIKWRVQSLTINKWQSYSYNTRVFSRWVCSHTKNDDLVNVQGLTDAGQNPTAVIQFDAGENPTL